MSAVVVGMVKETEGTAVDTDIEGDCSGEGDPVVELHPDTSIRETIKKMQLAKWFIVCALFLPEINVLFLSCRSAVCCRTFLHPDPAGNFCDQNS